MTPIRIAASSAIAIALSSCASQKNAYDTSNPYGAPDSGYAAAPEAPATEPANPVYDTPAAYEDGGAAPAPALASSAPAAAEAAAAPASSGNGAAIIHTVVKGDTLSGISKKYKVPTASIKQANRMTNDTVVLGRKMVIPPQ
jgi:nucleoid-associated protein YgaU